MWKKKVSNEIHGSIIVENNPLFFGWDNIGFCYRDVGKNKKNRVYFKRNWFKLNWLGIGKVCRGKCSNVGKKGREVENETWKSEWALGLSMGGNQLQFW